MAGQSGYCRAATAVNLLFGVFQVLLPGFRPGEAQGQAIDPIPNVVELWQAEEGELLMPAQAETEEDVEEHPQEQRSSSLEILPLQLRKGSSWEFQTDSLGKCLVNEGFMYHYMYFNVDKFHFGS